VQQGQSGKLLEAFGRHVQGRRRNLLGKPADCSGALGMSSCTWGDKNSFISVQYAGDKVLMFSGQGLK
jgi:hypothetical protein